MTKLHSEKLAKFVRSMNGQPRQRFNFQLCPSEVSAELTGYHHNGVCPVGLSTRLPIIVSHKIAELVPAFLWLGGGHKDVKLGCPVNKLIYATGAFTADVTYD